MAQPSKRELHTQIRALMLSSFNLEELRDLCFDLGIPYDDLTGEGLSARIRELILRMDREQRLDDLLNFCAHLRPKLTWPDLAVTPVALDVAPVQVALPQRNPRLIFISHARQDADFAHRLADDLAVRGWEVWIAPDSIRPGEKWVDAINRGLAESSIFALVLTPHAVNSRWVHSETNAAIGLQHKDAIRFIPLDVAPVTESPPLWQAYQWIPFQNNYRDGLERLMQELQPEQMTQIEGWYRQMQQAIGRNDWALAQKLGEQIKTGYPDYRETTARLALARREMEREQANQAEASRLYPHLKTAVVNNEWANALTLADQINRLVANYQDVAQLSERARRGQRQQQNQQRQDQWQKLQGQLRRFSRWGLSGGAVVILLLACVGTAIALSQLINKDEDNTPTPSRTRPVIADVTMALTTPAPTVTPTDTAEATETTQPTPSRTITPTWTPAPTLDPNVPPPNPQLHSTWTRPTDGMVMVFVPGGTFMMGSDPEVDDVAPSNEQPQHEVTLSDFWIDRTEVTNAMYRICVAAGVCDESSYAGDSRWNGDDYPVVGVSWYDADTYCEWADGQLPTEAQWEYAARGDDGRLYPWGDDPPTCDLAQFGDCDGDTLPVGSFPDGNSWVGASDMAGNVWEWVADWYGNYSSAATTNPTGPTSGDYKVLRGGSWLSDPILLRVAHRPYVDPDDRNDYIGFRCVVPPGN